MLKSVKLALAGSALLACALPASANAQTVYVDNYGYAPAYDYGYTYSDPYAWGGPTPFWPINAAAGLIGAAADAVAAPFVGWRDGYYVDQRIDPVRYGYDVEYAYPPVYSEAPVVRYSYDYGRPGWGGYVATYRGKVHARRHAMRMSTKSHVTRVSVRTKHKAKVGAHS